MYLEFSSKTIDKRLTYSHQLVYLMKSRESRSPPAVRCADVAAALKATMLAVSCRGAFTLNCGILLVQQGKDKPGNRHKMVH
jgi:hypothetical protein